MNTEIKAVLFDWGGVLAPSDNGIGAEVLAKKHDIDTAAFKSYCKEHEDAYGDTDDDAGFLELVAREFSFSAKEVADALNAASPHEGYELARQVAQQYPVYLVSNQLKFRTEYIREHFDLSFFSDTFFSNEVGILKPHAVFFGYVLGQIARDAQECVFVDDNVDNINTAAALGFTVVQVTDVQQMKESLIGLGLLD